MNTPDLTVIIPTLASSSRRDSLIRAIKSVSDQNEVATEILVVVNGDKFDPVLVEKLKSRSDIRILQLSKPSLTNAIFEGRKAIKTPFFSFLDDDDEYLPDSNLKRIIKLKSSPNCVMVASMGIRKYDDKSIPSAYNLRAALLDPFGELAINNWMTSCGGIFRADLVKSEVFRHIPQHHEWTYLAYKILTLGPFCIVDEACYVIHDTPGSLSKTSAYFQATADVLREILRLDLPPPVYRSVRLRLSKAEHDLASQALLNGFRIKAIRHHIASLLLPGGLTYIYFTRHLFRK